MNNRKQKFKKRGLLNIKIILLSGLVILLLSASLVVLIDYHVRSVGSEHIVDLEQVPSADAILVLGAYVNPTGRPSDILTDRLDTALEVYDQNAAKFLVSGDHGRTTYDEVNSMKNYIMTKKISAMKMCLWITQAFRPMKVSTEQRKSFKLKSWSLLLRNITSTERSI